MDDSIKYSINNLNLNNMDLTIGDGSPIYFIVYEIATKEIQPNCGIINDGAQLLDNSSAPHHLDNTPIFQKVTSTSKQKILDYVASEQLQDPNDFLSLLNE